VFVLGSRIEALTNVKLDDADTSRSIGEKTVMVRAARQLLSAITKVLILADRIVIKQLVTAKDQVIARSMSFISAGCQRSCSQFTQNIRQSSDTWLILGFSGVYPSKNPAKTCTKLNPISVCHAINN